MTHAPHTHLEQTLHTPAAADHLLQLGQRYGCIIHIARIIGGKRWSYVAGTHSEDMLSAPIQRAHLLHGYGAILYPLRPLSPGQTEQLVTQLNTFLENARRL